MRYFATLLFLSSIATTIINAQQEFAPIGAKWYVNNFIEETWITGFLTDYYIIESEGDTLIEGLDHRIVGDYLFHQDGDQVYYRLNDTLHLIYDFSVEVGDTVVFDLLECFGYEDKWLPITFRVSEVTEENIEGVFLKKVNCENIGTSLYYYEEYTYLERLGSLRQLIEGYVTCATTGTAYPEWLRCYQDEEVHYQTPMFLDQEEEDCEYVQISSTDETSVLNYLNIHPNPTANYWLLEWEYPKKAQLQLLDIQGNLIKAQQILSGSQKISAQDLSSGLYLMKVIGDGVSGSIKVLKE